MARNLIVGAGAAGAVAAAVVGGVIADRSDRTPSAAPRAGGSTICIESNVRLVEGMRTDCLTSAQYDALRDRAVIDSSGSEVELNLRPDAAGEVRTVRNCVEYDSLRGDGWQALTGADLRREEYFRRACGALAMLVEATPARQSHFAGGRAQRADILSMAREQTFALGEADGGGVAEVTELEKGVWRIATPQQDIRIFEIAHADFTGDGLGEILAYASVGAAGGTARTGFVGLIEKPAAGAPCAFTPA